MSSSSSGAGALSPVEVEAETVLCRGGGAGVVLRTVKPHDHVEGQLVGVHGDGGGREEPEKKGQSKASPPSPP